MTDEPLSDSFEMKLSSMARALGHPSRIAVLLAISKQGGEVQGEIVSVPDMAPGTVIQHLRDLKKAGLIGGKIFGAQAHYWLNKTAVSDFAEAALQLRTKLT